ncbi:MAG: LysE family transporter, partial [Thermoplasmata archaeon]|nr:LysE family transporter [Thermoplasmata archaeon]
MEPITDNIWIFFGIAILISFSGVMMPGPVFAAAVAKGYENEKAGIKVAIGHGIVEFPLMVLIILSVGYVFTDDRVMALIGLVGGGLLVFLGASMFRSRKMTIHGGREMFPYKP